MKEFLDIGFQSVGRWHLSESGLQLSLERLQDSAPALYAFVLRGEVMYVGKTKRTLGQRLYGYLKGSGTQRTNIRVRAYILEALRTHDAVEILGFRDRERRTVGKFKINLPAGLEDDIITQLSPPWNGRGEPRRDDQDVVKLVKEDAEASSAAESHQQSEETKTSDGRLTPSFLVTVAKTYYRQGFFNVPVDYERYFAGDGANATMDLPDAPTSIKAKLNRRANMNHTPRVMGGAKFRDWLQQHVRVGGQIRVVVHGPTQIQIIPV